MSDCWQVTLPYATFGIVVADGQVIDSAPIARWTVGRSWADVAAYFRRRQAKISQLPARPGNPSQAGLRCEDPRQ